MKVVVFGMDRCKFCKKQTSFLESSFKDNEWLYVDIVKDKDGLQIASTVNVDKLPTIIVLNNKNQEIFRKEGTLPCDRIFQLLTKDKGSIPVNAEESRKFLESKNGEVLLSYDPNLKRGQQIKIRSFEGKMLFNAQVNSCRKVSITNGEVKSEIKNNYLKKGGRKDIGWEVSFFLTSD